MKAIATGMGMESAKEVPRLQPQGDNRSNPGNRAPKLNQKPKNPITEDKSVD